MNGPSTSPMIYFLKEVKPKFEKENVDLIVEGVVRTLQTTIFGFIGGGIVGTWDFVILKQFCLHAECGSNTGFLVNTSIIIEG